MATAAVILALGSAMAFACTHGPGPANATHPSVAHAAVSEHTPPLCQLVKRPAPPNTGPKLHLL